MKKTKVPTLLAIYKANWGGRRWGSTVWREAFGYDKRLPLSGGTKIVVDSSRSHQVVLYLEAAGPKGQCKHRVFVKCPRCSKRIPAGRIHQHTCI